MPRFGWMRLAMPPVVAFSLFLAGCGQAGGGSGTDNGSGDEADSIRIGGLSVTAPGGAPLAQFSPVDYPLGTFFIFRDDEAGVSLVLRHLDPAGPGGGHFTFPLAADGLSAELVWVRPPVNSTSLCRATGGTMHVDRYEPPGGRISGTFLLTAVGGDATCPQPPLQGSFISTRQADYTYGNDGTGTDTVTVERDLAGAPPPAFPAVSTYTESAGTLYNPVIWTRLQVGTVVPDVLVFLKTDPDPALGMTRRLLIRFPGPLGTTPVAATLIEDASVSSLGTGGCQAAGIVTLTQTGEPGGVIEGDFDGVDMTGSDGDCPVTGYHVHFAARREADSDAGVIN